MDILPELEPVESVQCVVTSPPYWGLRDYGINPVVWDDPGCCEHVWGNERKRVIQEQQATYAGQCGPKASQPNRKRVMRESVISEYKNISQGQFCQKCQAWRGSLGLEPTPELYVKHIVQVFRGVRRVLRKDGTCWINLGDSYVSNAGAQVPQTMARKGSGYAGTNRNGMTGLKSKDLTGIPWRVALALQADGWWLRSDIIWHKSNPMPESVTDRPTRSHEYMFLLTKSAKYFYDADAIKEPASHDTHARYARGRSDNHKWSDGGPGNQTIAKSFDHMRKPGVTPKSAPAGSRIKANESFHAAVKDHVENRNKRTVWTIPTQPFPEAHFATFPEKLVIPCIKAGSSIGDIILDPFAGAGTVAKVAQRFNRKAIGIELNPDYCEIISRRLDQGFLPLKKMK